MTAKQNKPALRFPEFFGFWNKDSLDEIVEIIDGDRGINYPSNNDFSDQGYCLFLNAKNVTKSGFSFVDTMFISKERDGLLRKGKLRRFDIVLTTRGTLGNVAFFNSDIQFDNIRINSGMVILRKNAFPISVEYLFVFLKAQHFTAQVEFLSFGSAQPQLTVAGIKTIRIPIPPLLEQQKIAAFLTAVDEKIQQLTRKKALLEQYKKGVMQQLFSREIRFRPENGEEYPEWEGRTLGELVTYPFTNSFSRSQLNYEFGEVKNIHYGDIHTRFQTLFDITREKVPFINEDIEIEKWNEHVFCKPGDIIIADASEDYKDVGKAIEIVNVGNDKLVAGLHTYIARPNEGVAATGFLGYLFQVDYVRKQIMTMATGISVLGISKTNLNKLVIYMPSIPDQQKIASFLSALDEKIGQVGQQLEQAKGWKKGLLQGMFV